LSHPQGGVFASLLQLAHWFEGGPAPPVTTWPAWGYAWLIVWLRSVDLLLAIQVCSGVLALWALVLRLRDRMPAHGTLIAVLCVIAIPWHDMQLTLYPSGLAGSLMLFAVLSMDTAIAENRVARAVLAGVLIGIAQNLRTEFVLLPLFVGI